MTQRNKLTFAIHLTLLGAAAPVLAGSYSVVEIPTVTPAIAETRAINNAGNALATAFPSFTENTVNFFHQGGISQKINNSLGGFAHRIWANGMNDTNQIVGWAYNSTQMQRAFKYDPATTTMADLGTLGGATSEATDINNKGQIVGWAQKSNGTIKPFFRSSTGQMITIDTPTPDYSVATAIADSGTVTGWYNAAGHRRAFIYHYMNESSLPADIGTLGGEDSVAHDITGNAIIVGGSSLANGETHPFLYVDSHMLDIGNLPNFTYCEAQAINYYMNVVGFCSRPSSDFTQEARAFLYKDGRLTDINDLVEGSGWIITRAYDINDAGFIAAEGIKAGVKQAVLIKPGQRTVVFMQGQTVSGQDMFLRGGIDWNYSKTTLGRDCSVDKWLCAIPIVHNVLLLDKNRANDHYLDWHSAEYSQTSNMQGSPLVWTTSNPSYAKKVAKEGYGYTPLNTWGDHYWMLDIQMDCSKTVGGWFELKSYISNGPGWEPNIAQAGTPYQSGNHFAKCGKINKFIRGSNSVEFRDF